jgi:hypothetical protein
MAFFSQLIIAALAAVAITGVVVAPGSAQSTARTDMVRTARGANAFGIPAARRKRVSNEVGKNHQAAQDDLQAHGFYRLRELDVAGDSSSGTAIGRSCVRARRPARA